LYGESGLDEMNSCFSCGFMREKAIMSFCAIRRVRYHSQMRKHKTRPTKPRATPRPTTSFSPWVDVTRVLGTSVPTFPQTVYASVGD
jgi:hypothetical protein